jgi:hypothetical protein
LRKSDDMTVIAETIARLRARRFRQRGKQHAQKTK